MTFNEAVMTLGLDVAASKADIKQAYRVLAAKNHPDKFQDDVEKKVAERNFRKIQEAYDFLNDLRPAINIEDRMTRSGYDKESDAIKNSLDEILKMRPMSEGSFSYSDVNTTQNKIMKLLLLSIPLYILAIMIFFFWTQVKAWLVDLF